MERNPMTFPDLIGELQLLQPFPTYTMFSTIEQDFKIIYNRNGIVVHRSETWFHRREVRFL